MNSMRLAVGLKDIIYIYIFFFENERNFIFLIFFLVEKKKFGVLMFMSNSPL